MEEIKKEPVTVLLILINTLIFLVVEFTGGSENGQHMLECGAAYAPLILEQGQWYRMFSSMFLHFGAPHLINNMLVLFVLGQRLEPVTGKIKFFLIYIFGGLGGNMLSLFFDMYAGNASLSAGASGAVFAVMGGMIYVIIRHRGRVADLTVRQMLIKGLCGPGSFCLRQKQLDTKYDTMYNIEKRGLSADHSAKA